jgi:Fe-S-cluster containining protein
MGCGRCGKCCREISIPGIDYYNMRSFLENHPFLVHVGPRWGPNGQMVPMFNCFRLVKQGNVLSCLEYDLRPDFCREFPEVGQPVPSTCSITVEIGVL